MTRLTETVKGGKTDRKKHSYAAQESGDSDTCTNSKQEAGKTVQAVDLDELLFW